MNHFSNQRDGVESETEFSHTLGSILSNKMSSAQFFQEIWQKEAACFPCEGVSKALPGAANGGIWRDSEMQENPIGETLQNGWHVVQHILEQAQLRNERKEEHHQPLLFQNRELKSPLEIQSLYGTSLFAPYLDGCSVVLNHGDLLSPWIAGLCQDLQREFPHVYANCYLTPPNSQAVLPHADDRDVFVLQLVGSKEWKVYQQCPIPYPYPHEQVCKNGIDVPQGVLQGPLCIDTTLKSGDVLYMPRGFVHEARSPSNEFSFHITFALATHDWSLAGMISMEAERIMTQVVENRRSVLPCRDPNLLQEEVCRALDTLKEKITAKTILSKLDGRINIHNQRVFGSRMKLINEARVPPAPEEANQKSLNVGPHCAMKVTYTSIIRAATPEERASVPTDSDNPRGLNVREEIADSVYAIIGKLKSDLSIQCRVMDLSALLPTPNPQLCDLALLSLAKRAVELGAFAVVDSFNDKHIS